ncbi:MAG: VOC family protein [Salibacteraceae bacterium]
MIAYIEHANISVSSLHEGIRFFKTAFPHFYIRGKGRSGNEEWVHFGTKETYVALNIASVLKEEDDRYVRAGFNHLGYVVKDSGAVAKRLIDAGYKRSYPRQEESSRIREYFFDADGNEYEFIEYLTEKWTERNNYED